MSQTVTGPPSRPLRLVLGMTGSAVGGALFIVLNSWFATSTGADDVSPLRLMATLVQGPPATTSAVWVGVVVHVVLSLAFGALFSVLARPRMSATMLAFAGLAYGGLLYVVNFQLLSRYVDYWSAFLDTTNQPFELAVHLVFGAVLAAFMLPARNAATRTRLSAKD